MSIVTASSCLQRSGPSLLEELAKGRRVLAAARPHDALGDVIDDHGDVLVMPAVGQLVDADVLQAVERICRAKPVDDTAGDVAHGAPSHAHRVDDRGLVGRLGEVGGVLLEVPGEPRVTLGPGDELDADAAPRAVDAPDRVAKQQPHPGQVEVPPAPAALVVALVDPTAAARAPRDGGRRRDVGDHALVVERDGFDTRVLHLREWWRVEWWRARM